MLSLACRRLVWQARLVALDPIVSLTVAIAEAPGSYAFFLGSGVSRDAGVPTGSEVYWLAVGELYRLANETKETPDELGLQEWLDGNGRADAGYSDVLELLVPDQATRRDYLAKHFEGVEPGATHERLAELAARGLARVFVTTNFDRLLEHALSAKGIEPVVITSPEELGRAPRREHAQCYVLKPHGDYLQETIRNTPAELAELEEAVAGELQEILDRYGVVVLGYSGSDEGIATAFRSRVSRYGVYWVARATPLAEPARTLVEGVDGRLIVRDGAASFLADLDRRLAVFEAQPSGLTPLTITEEVVALLRRNDRVGLRELFRGERREFQQRSEAVVEGNHNERPTTDIALHCHAELMPALERRLAGLLPLALHDEEMLAEEIASLVDLKDGQGTPNGFTFWYDIVAWLVWSLGYVLGAYAVQQRRYGILRAIFAAETRDRHGGTEPLVQSIPGEAGYNIGAAVMARVDDRNYLAPGFEALRHDLAGMELARQRFPELVETEHEPLRSLLQFDFLLAISLGLRGHRAVSHWTMYSGHGEDWARRLHASHQLRSAVAASVDLTVEEFDERAPQALEAARSLNQFPDTEAIAILQTGSRA